jgi:hypothetical protein
LAVVNATTDVAHVLFNLMKVLHSIFQFLKLGA